MSEWGLETCSAGELSLEGCYFKLFDIELMRGGTGWTLDQQLVDSCVLIVVINGTGSLMIDHHHYRLRTDTVFLCRPGQTFGMQSGPEEGLDVYLLRFHLLTEAANTEEEILPAKLIVDIRNDRGAAFPLPECIEGIPVAQTMLLCDSIYSRWTQAAGLDRLRNQIDFLELVFWIARHAASRQRYDSRSALERTKQFMERQFHESLSLEQLARMADISPKYYGELFKKTYGISPIDYLTRLRMNRAKQLMAQSAAKLKDIARQIGYSDEFYFSRKFKKEEGVSPTAFIKSRRRKIAVYSSALIGQLAALNMVPYAAPLHPKWTSHYYKLFGSDIAVPLSGYKINEHREANLALLEAARPDLVLAMDTASPEERERLASIAPVLVVPSRQCDWKEQLLTIAGHLDAAAEADSWLQYYDRITQSASERLKQSLGTETIAILRIYKENVYIHSSRGMTEVFYGDLGLKSALPLKKGQTLDIRVSEEQLDSFDADRVMVLVCQEPQSLRTWKSLKFSEAWQQLWAVRSNRVYLLSSFPWREYSATAHEHIVETSLTLFAGNHP